MDIIFEEPSSDVIFYRRWNKRVYCSHYNGDGTFCRQPVIGQINTEQYVYHYCSEHKLEQASRVS